MTASMIPRCHPLSDLEVNAAAIVREATESGESVLVTRQGQGVAVLVPMAVFEKMQAAEDQLALQQAVDEAEQGLAEGRWVEHAEVEARLRRWTRGER